MFKLFGTSLVSLRILGLCISMLIPLLIYAISRTMTSRVLSLTAALPATFLGIPFFNFVPFAVWQGIVATLAAVFFYMRATMGGQRYWAFLAGLMTAAAILLRHDQGFYLVIAILAYSIALTFVKYDVVAKPALKPILGLWTTGIGILMLPAGIYWFMCGALPHMIKQLVIFPVTAYAKTSSLPFPVFSSDLSFVQNTMVGLFYFSPLIMIIIALWLLNLIRRGSFYLREGNIAFILLLSGLFYCQVLTRSDMGHLLITLPPFFILCACCLQTLLDTLGGAAENVFQHRSASIVARSIASIFLGAVVVWFLLSTKPIFLTSPQKSMETIMLDRAGVQVNKPDSIMGVVRTIQRYAPSDRSILCLPYLPMFYFLCERRNPTQWNYLWPGDQTSADHEMLIRQARNDPPAVVMILNESRMQRYASTIIDYVHAEYEEAYNFAGCLIYLPLTKGRHG